MKDVGDKHLKWISSFAVLRKEQREPHIFFSSIAIHSKPHFAFLSSSILIHLKLY